MTFFFLQIRESEEEWGVPHSFTLFGQRQSVVVAARYEWILTETSVTFRFLIRIDVNVCMHSCVSEMERWVEDIRMAIDLAEQSSSLGADLLSTSLSNNSMCPGFNPKNLTANVTLSWDFFPRTSYF